MKTIKVLLVPVFLLSLFFVSCEETFDDRDDKVQSVMYKGLEHEGNESTDLLLTNDKLEIITEQGEEGVMGINLQSERSLNMYTEPVDLNTEGKVEIFYSKNEEVKDDPIVGISMERFPNGEQVIKGFAANSENIRIEAYKDGQLVYRNDEFEGRWVWIPFVVAGAYIGDHASFHWKGDKEVVEHPDGTTTTTTTTSTGFDWNGSISPPDTGGGYPGGVRIELEDYSVEIDMIQVVAVTEGESNNSDSNPYVEIKTQNIEKYTIVDEDTTPLAFLPSWGILFGQPDFLGQCSGSGVCGFGEYPYPHLPYDFDVNEAKLIGTSQPEEDKIQLEWDATHFSQEKIQEVFGEEYFLMQEPAVLGNELVKHLNKKYGELVGIDEITLPVGEYEIERFYTDGGELQSIMIPIVFIVPWGVMEIQIYVVFIKI